MNSKTELIVVRGKMIVNRYETDILQPIALPFPREHCPEFLYMHDNARPHTAATISKWCEDHYIPLLEWSAQSPD